MSRILEKLTTFFNNLYSLPPKKLALHDGMSMEGPRFQQFCKNTFWIIVPMACPFRVLFLSYWTPVTVASIWQNNCTNKIQEYMKQWGQQGSTNCKTLKKGETIMHRQKEYRALHYLFMRKLKSGERKCFVYLRHCIMPNSIQLFQISSPKLNISSVTLIENSTRVLVVHYIDFPCFHPYAFPVLHAI
jgi:hypothetical protein